MAASDIIPKSTSIQFMAFIVILSLLVPFLVVFVLYDTPERQLQQKYWQYHTQIKKSLMNSNIITENTSFTEPALHILNNSERIRYYMGHWYKNKLDLEINNFTEYKKKHLHKLIHHFLMFDGPPPNVSSDELYFAPFHRYINQTIASKTFECQKDNGCFEG